jgi:hypothetical protein
MPYRRRLYAALVAAGVSLVLSAIYRVFAVEAVNDLFFPFCGRFSKHRGKSSAATF